MTNHRTPDDAQFRPVVGDRWYTSGVDGYVEVVKIDGDAVFVTSMIHGTEGQRGSCTREVWEDPARGRYVPASQPIADLATGREP